MANPKGNPQNLQPVRSKEEASKKGQKGGIKSQQVQRERRRAKECMEMILSLQTKSKKQKELMSNMGIKDEDQQNIMSLMASMFARAVTTGEPNAVKSVLEIAGEFEEKPQGDEKPTININISAATAADMEDED